MGRFAPRTLTEEPLSGSVPRFEIPQWRERLGVVAGITGRADAAGRDFDLGLWTDAPVREVMTRWRTFRHAFPECPATALGNQVHGVRLAWHDQVTGWAQLDGIDGHATRQPGVLLCVTVADCVPVYLVDPRERAIALLHAGWRGTAGGILAEGVKLLTERAGSTPANLVMHCGVGICGACYEVGAEVMEGCGRVPTGPGPWHLDLREVLAEQAGVLGIGELSVSSWCAAHDGDWFFSHRASHGRDGRLVAYLGIPSA